MSRKLRIESCGLILLTCVCFAAGTAQGAVLPQPSHTFTIGTNDFLLDGKPFQIRCGEIHAPRVPKEYWPHRLRMAHAMGLNAVCAYLFWNMQNSAASAWPDQLN